MAMLVVDSKPNAAPVVAEPEKEPVKPPEKEEGKTESQAAPEAAADEEEDENGLTASERAELTAKMQKAIGKRTRELRQAEEFAADQYNNRRLAEGKVSQLEQQIAQLQEQIKAAKPVDPDADKPTREKFETQEAYEEAIVEYRVKRQLEKERLDALKKATEERHAAIVQAAEGRVAKAKELVPDYAETLENADVRVPPDVATYMQESEMIAELSYHFAKHPEVLERVSKMTPRAQLVEIGRIESKLQPFAPVATTTDTKANANMASQNDEESSTETSTRTSESRAPVIKPITSGSGSQVETPEGKKSVREVISEWEKRNGRNLHQRKRH